MPLSPPFSAASAHIITSRHGVGKRLPQVARPSPVGLLAIVSVLLTSGCGKSRTNTSLPPTPTQLKPSSSAPTFTPTVPRATGSSTCTNARVIKTWPAARLAAEVVAVPVLNFDLSAVESEVSDGVGGVLFLGNGPAPIDLGTQIRSLLRNAPPHTQPLVMADEEGGGVQRLAPVVSSVPWPRDMAQTMTAAAVRNLAARVGRQMNTAGVTVDLAPVADVDDRPGPSLINPDGARSFSENPQTAATYTVAFAERCCSSCGRRVLTNGPAEAQRLLARTHRALDARNAGRDFARTGSAGTAGDAVPCCGWFEGPLGGAASAGPAARAAQDVRCGDGEQGAE